VWQRAPTEAEDIAARERKPRRTTKLCDDVKTVGINMNQRKKWRVDRRRGLAASSPTSKQDRSWETTEQLAKRYQLSIRMIAYMAKDGTLPHYKIGHALRFDPLECDQAMKAFRRASIFDEV
jgi:hypothetical protein